MSGGDVGGKHSKSACRGDESTDSGTCFMTGTNRAGTCNKQSQSNAHELAVSCGIQHESKPCNRKSVERLLICCRGG